MSIVCAFDQTVHATRESLHEHLRDFRISQQRYYQTYEPRYDLVTNELIPFRSYEQYINTDFVSKNTLKKWLQANPEKGFEWSKAWLSKRKEAKGLVYAPPQVELRTLCCPSMPYFNEIGKSEGGYYSIAAALGFKPRYKAATPTFSPLASDAVILQDTREQLPVKFTRSVKVETLDVGDYALDKPYDKGVRIERKSLGDWAGTLSARAMVRKGKKKTTVWSNFERFDKELARAVEQDLYVVMVVEASINEAQSLNYLPQYKWIKASSEYLFHNLRELLTKYPLNFQAVFIDTKKHKVADKMTRIFELGEQVKTLDLQYLYEENEV